MNPSENTLRGHLYEVWLRERNLHLYAGWLAFIRWLLPLFLICMLVDWKADLPSGFRGVLILFILGYSAFKAWRAGWQLLRPFDAAQTALKVEKEHGGLDSLLVTAVQHADSNPTPGTSEALLQKTVEKATNTAKGLHAENTVSFQILRQPAMVALVPVVAILLFAILNGPFLGAGLTRFFAPWVEVAYPTRTQIHIADADWVVKEGDALKIQAGLAGVIPEKAKIVLKTGSGQPMERTLAVANKSCEYNAGAVFRSFEYRIFAGDAKSLWHTVRVVSAPKIEKVEVTLTFPEYTQRPAETLEALTLTVPEGTGIEWKLTLDRPVREAKFQPSGGESAAMDISHGGQSVSFHQVANQSRAYNFSWVGRDPGFAFESPRFYLQVAPDRPPSVELTEPPANLIATLGRELEFAYTGRDDHGIGKAVFSYRLNKSGEEKLDLPAPEPGESGKQKVDWDHREALPDLAEGDTLSVAVEVADNFNGEEGAHRARSESRRIQFLSKEDYLAHIEKQKRRLLNRIKSIYREERGIHDAVRSLDPAADSFAQSCQLEAVRQDLVRDRLFGLAGKFQGLLDDLAANQLSEEPNGADLESLAGQLRDIAEKEVAKAASLFRNLASISAGQKDPSDAIHQVDRSARELGLLVLQLGFRDASDVLARELHATAQEQASLRLKTILAKGNHRAEQTRLAEATERLLSAIPQNKESTPLDALTAFTLSRMVNELVRNGAVNKMKQAAGLIGGEDNAKAISLQADVIAACLGAEFRLRIGSEFEALEKARDLFLELAVEQGLLRQKAGKISHKEMAKAQDGLFRKLKMLLMPEIPALRPQVYDPVPPAAPPVNRKLASAEIAIQSAYQELVADRPEDATHHQQQAETLFAELAAIVLQRQEILMESIRFRGMLTVTSKFSGEVTMMEERLLQLLEKTEDAASDEIHIGAFSRLGEGLLADISQLRDNISGSGIPEASTLPITEKLGLSVDALTTMAPLLKQNQPDPAIEQQEEALIAVEETLFLFEELAGMQGSHSSVLQLTSNVLNPSPKLAEIEDEQTAMMKATEKAKPEEYKKLVIPQKNLVHAVNAVLDSMDSLAHKVESGTTLLFAKDDMDAAAIGLEEDDLAEALDAQSYVAESIAEIREKVDAVTPQYRYIREISDYLYEAVPRGGKLGLQVKHFQDGDKAALVKQLKEHGEGLARLTGDDRYSETTELLAGAIGGEEGDLEDALDGILADTEDLQLLMKNLAYLIAPPGDLSNIEEPIPEVKLILQTLDIAAFHKDLLRLTHAAPKGGIVSFAEKQLGLAQQCSALLAASEDHPQLVAAQGHLAKAASQLKASEQDKALASQIQAREGLRHFLIEYALEYVDVPPPPPPQDDGGPSEESPEDSELQLLMPGALTGKRPKGGRQEWQVLGNRDRAALNENFARELPLEYRAILKDYYEKLAQ